MPNGYKRQDVGFKNIPEIIIIWLDKDLKIRLNQNFKHKKTTSERIQITRKTEKQDHLKSGLKIKKKKIKIILMAILLIFLWYLGTLSGHNCGGLW